MKNNEDTNEGGADDASWNENAKGSSGSASPADAREPWRLAVAAAEAAADAQLGYKKEVTALRQELAAAVVPSAAMKALRERVTELEQRQRNIEATPTVAIPPTPETSSAVKWLLAAVLLWLAWISGVVVRHWHDDAVALQTMKSMKGGLLP